MLNHRSIQKPTSIGQILPDGWQEMWRSCVKEVLALRRNPEIVEAFNRQRPHEMPVEILPVSHICNFDQSPQSVEPVANTTLARRESGNVLSKQEEKRRRE